MIYILPSNSLLSKYGFCDGDQFSHFFYENDYDIGCNQTTQQLSMDKQVLKVLVERYLLPAFSKKVQIVCVNTHHNPIRIHSDDYDWLSKQSEITIEITEKQVREACEEVRTEYSI